MNNPAPTILSFNIKFVFIVITALFVLNEAVYTRDELNAVPNVDYRNANASRDDVFYYFYQNCTQKEGILLANTITNGTNIEFNGNLPTKFFIHGFTTSYKSPWYPLLKQKYFKKGLHNIFYVDWSKAGNLTYKQSSANIQPIGDYIADFILQTKIPLNRIHLIGHSLGSHLTGFIGKSIFEKTGAKLGRITALDAAGPGFDRITNQSLRLCQNDAEFVDAYHTDIDYYGFKAPLGHVDFYPNGGKNQPGCDRLSDDNASHARSTLFFIESVGRNDIKAQQAEYLGDERIRVVENGAEIRFGDSLTGRERGVYVVETAANPPFFQKIA